MTAVNFEASYITALLTDTTIANNFINQAINIITGYNLDGINVDFENVPTANRGSIMNTFMLKLTNAIHAALPGKEVSFAGPAVNWGGWDFRGLANACDYIFIMGYDFYGSWSTTTGPSAPLDPTAGSSISIRNTVETQYAAVTNSTPEKLILGVPYYGQRWATADSLPHSGITSYISSTRFRDDAATSSLHGILWANDNKVPWYRFRSAGVWHQVWFDNDSSLGLKYKLAIDKKFKGVGMWALGYDGSRDELWNELKRNFYTEPIDSITPENKVLRINQNYPNPFYYQTLITYSLKENSNVSLVVYDVLGREIARLVHADQPVGDYSVSFNANEFKLSSGIYYYIFKTDNIIQTKKMIYLK
jgi:spore germination protein YaaH